MAKKGVPVAFTYSDYGDIIRAAKRMAPVWTLGGWTGGNGTILRHDVDLDIPCAKALADVEKGLGVRSSFFVMATNRYYNPIFKDNADMLRAMADDGFEIGLHFDPSVYGCAGHDELERRLELECAILESATDHPVRSVSLHNPSLTGQYPLFDGYRNAYDPEIFSDKNYMSDSCMGFRGKDPLEFLERAAGMPIQVVFHPMQWSEDGRDYVGFFTDQLCGLVDYIDSTMRVNGAYKRHIGSGSLRDMLRRKLDGREED